MRFTKISVVDLHNCDCAVLSCVAHVLVGLHRHRNAFIASRVGLHRHGAALHTSELSCTGKSYAAHNKITTEML